MECKASTDPWDRLKLDGQPWRRETLHFSPVTSSGSLSVSPTSSVVINPDCRPKTSKASSSSESGIPSLGFLIFESSLCFYFSLYFSFFVSVSVPPPFVPLSIISSSFSILLTFVSITSPSSLDNIPCLTKTQNKNPEAWLIHKSLSI